MLREIPRTGLVMSEGVLCFELYSLRYVQVLQLILLESLWTAMDYGLWSMDLCVFVGICHLSEWKVYFCPRAWFKFQMGAEGPICPRRDAES